MVNGLVTRLCFDSSRKTSELSLKTCPDRNFVDNYRHATNRSGLFSWAQAQRWARFVGECQIHATSALNASKRKSVERFATSELCHIGDFVTLADVSAKAVAAVALNRLKGGG